MNIQETALKIKTSAFRNRELLRDLAIPILIILVGIGSFGLGRLSALEGRKQPISVSQGALGAMSQGGYVVASKTGTKYHFPWCAGANNIAEQNKLTFKDEKSARQAGYLPAGNCKGLK